MISADTKDALARDVPTDSHCRQALLAALAFYGGGHARGEFVTHRNTVARLFWSLLDERKAHPIETRAPTRLQRLPTFAISLPDRLKETPPKPARKCDRLMEVRAAFLAGGSLAAGAHVITSSSSRATTTQPRACSDAAEHRHAAEERAPQRARRALFKDFDTIAEVLARMGAFATVLRLEDVRALRETKNRIHRLVNTEAAIWNAGRRRGRTAPHDRVPRRRLRHRPPLAGAAGSSGARMSHPDESLAELDALQSGDRQADGQRRLAALAKLAGRLQGVQGR